MAGKLEVKTEVVIGNALLLVDSAEDRRLGRTIEPGYFYFWEINAVNEQTSRALEPCWCTGIINESEDLFGVE